MSLITTPLIILLLFFITISTVFIVKQQSAAIIERFGKFQSVRKPGFQVKIPLVDRIAGRLSLKVLQLDVVVETKTSDDVFVKLKVSVQYRVVESKVFDAFYKLDFPQDQITSYVFDLIRSQVPKMKLDDVFSKQDDIAVAVKQSLGDAMEEYGYFIVKALVTDIEPDAEVKRAMNRINAADREKTAAQYEGDAARILIVEKAKAEQKVRDFRGRGLLIREERLRRVLKILLGHLELLVLTHKRLLHLLLLHNTMTHYSLLVVKLIQT